MVLNPSLNIYYQNENSCEEEIICVLCHFYNFSHLILSNALSEPDHQPSQHWELVFPQTKGSFLVTEVSQSHGSANSVILKQIRVHRPKEELEKKLRY